MSTAAVWRNQVNNTAPVFDRVADRMRGMRDHYALCGIPVLVVLALWLELLPRAAYYRVSECSCRVLLLIHTGIPHAVSE